MAGGDTASARARAGPRLSYRSYREWIEDCLVLLSDGDVTKLRSLLVEWGPDECVGAIRRRTEHREAERAILGFCGIQLPWLSRETAELAPQGIGQACGQHPEMLKLCGAFYGDQLAVGCRRCPGPER
jgi:hypothetical protein